MFVESVVHTMEAYTRLIQIKEEYEESFEDDSYIYKVT